MIKEKKFDVGTFRSGFRVDSVQYVEEVQSTSYVMTHIQSGAKLLYLANDDDNKVFPCPSVRHRTTVRVYHTFVNIRPCAGHGNSP